MDAIRVAIVTADRLFREGLQQILSRDPSLVLTSDAPASTDRDADIRVVDARLGVPEPADTSSSQGRPHVVVVNVPDDDAWAADALTAGVRGVLAQTAGADDLLRAIRVVHEGGIWAPRRWLIACVKRSVGTRHEGPAGGSRTIDKRLSKRECEVFRHAATGVGNKEVAGRLAISEATVKAHMTRIFQKLGVSGRAELVAAYYGFRPGEPEAVVRRSA